MTDTDYDDWFVATYDRFVGSEGDAGSDLEKTRDAVAHAYADAIESGEIGRPAANLVDEGRQMFDRHVGRERTRRRTHFVKNVEYLAAALDGETILGRDEPVFQLSFPLGDGRDKMLAYWTIDDWQSAVNTRNSNAVAAAAQAHEFQVAVKPIIGALQARSARRTVDLYAGATA